MEETPMYVNPVAAESPEARSVFLRQVAVRTLGGLAITAIASLLSAVFVAPALFQTNKWVVLAVLYGCIFGAQMLGRRMVYGEAKAGGLVVGAGLQGVALGFLLLVAIATSAPGEGLALIGYSLLMVVLSVAAMLLYVTTEKREFSMLRAGLAMMGIPLLIMMGLQVIFPFDGMAGVVISGVFLAVSVGALLYSLNKVIHEFPVTMPTEAAFELTIGIVVFFWNLLSFFMRMRRR